MAACIPSLLLLYPFLISTTEQSSLPIVTVVIFFGLFVSLNSKNTWNSCAHLTWLANKFLVSLLNFHFLRTHLYREKSHLLLWRRGCCLCCRLQLLWNPFSMFVATAMLWSKFPHNLCLLRQDEIVSTWVGNARTNTPKLRMASTSHLLLVSAWGFTFDIRTVEAYQIMYCMQYSWPLQGLCQTQEPRLCHGVLKQGQTQQLRFSHTTLRCAHNFCSPGILQAGRIELAKVWHAKADTFYLASEVFKI